MFRLRSRQNSHCHGVTVITIPGATMATTGVVTTVTVVATATVPTGAMIIMGIVIPVAIHLISGTEKRTKNINKKCEPRGKSADSHFLFNVILGS